MKKTLSIIALGAATLAASAQAPKAYTPATFGQNWSIGLDGGVTTTLHHRGHGFGSNMRGAFGMHVQKQLSPVFALGLEGNAGVNTSSWHTATVTDILGHQFQHTGKSNTGIDNLYIGTYGSVNLMNLFGGYRQRLFDIELTAGAGWGHDFIDHFAFLPYTVEAKDQNYFATKVGVNFNFNVCRNLTVAFKPSVGFNMTGTHYDALNVGYTTAAYKRQRANMNLLASVTYNFGPGFRSVETRNPAEIDALNAQINALRGDLAAAQGAQAAAAAKAAGLQSQLTECLNRKPEVIKEVEESNNLQSVRYIFYRLGSSTITPDQAPNVEMVATYLKNRPSSKVVIKGYASPDGNLENNIKLAQARAEAVKDALISKYGIKADRIKAEGEGIGHMFTENDWNRVSICLLED